MKISNFKSSSHVSSIQNKKVNASFLASCIAGGRTYSLKGNFIAAKPKIAKEKIAKILEKFEDKIKDKKSSSKIKESLKNKFKDRLKSLKIKVNAKSAGKKVAKFEKSHEKEIAKIYEKGKKLFNKYF